jgi:IS5 family transposase
VRRVTGELADVADTVATEAGKATRAEEHRRAFRRTVKWRTGIEGRISTLKRGYGWDRTRIDGTQGARIWAGHGVLATT